MKLLPDENPTQFDYLHAIRALTARSGNKQVFDLADAGMQLGDPAATLVKRETECASLREQLDRSEARNLDMQIAIDAVWDMWARGGPLSLAVDLVRPLATKKPKPDPMKEALMEKVGHLVGRQVTPEVMDEIKQATLPLIPVSAPSIVVGPGDCPDSVTCTLNQEEKV